ncbi:MAG: lysophospholipid acyltransferase family protein [Prolixibacteraceae bacterium]|jgi:1-acyl-sn-glycerol-3-phosphate acyltransferase|nr:lysophospholipid acyltransferase family protein [Prolixibacteraceae bacterium]
MIKSEHHPVITKIFDWYIPHIIKKDFARVETIGEWQSITDRASLIIGNHVSWWDGFWVLHLNHKFLHKDLHVMILEEQLKKNKILSKVGAYSVNPGSRSVVESLKYTAELLSDKNNAVVVYPQGRISTFTGPSFNFKPGIEWVLKKSNPIQLLFYTAFVDYFSERKPTLHLYLGEIEFQHYSLIELRDKYRDFYSHCLSQYAKKEL